MWLVWVLLTASKSLLGLSKKGENKGLVAEVDELLRSIFVFDLVSWYGADDLSGNRQKT